MDIKLSRGKRSSLKAMMNAYWFIQKISSSYKTPVLY